MAITVSTDEPRLPFPPLKEEALQELQDVVHAEGRTDWTAV